MANHKSAKKRARQNEVRRVHNKSIISNARGTIKSFTLGLAETTDPSKLQESFKSVQSTIQKAVSKGLVHKNTASRKISRLSSAMKKTLESASK